LGEKASIFWGIYMDLGTGTTEYYSSEMVNVFWLRENADFLLFRGEGALARFERIAVLREDGVCDAPAERDGIDGRMLRKPAQHG